MKELCFDEAQAFMESELSYVFDKCIFFSKYCCNISNTFLDPIEQGTIWTLLYHDHPQNLQSVQLQQVFNS